MPSRRAHTKSRHGCANCKTKRIKCDESRPRCGRCTEQDLACSYSCPEWSCTVVNGSRKRGLSTDSDPKKHVATETICQSDLGQTELQNLELMVQWCNHTHLTLSRSDSVSWIWRSAIPRKAAHHPFLMNGILALSALHSAFSNIDTKRKRYLELAQTHHSKAIEGLSHIKHLEESNADAAYALSNIIIIFTFALPLCTQPGSGCDFTQELLEIFHISKGSMKVLMEVHHWVQAGDLAGLISMQEHSNAPPALHDKCFEHAITSLEHLNRTHHSQNGPSSDLHIYSEAICALQLSFKNIECEGSIGAITAAFRFIFCISPQFLELIAKREPLALVVLANYGVIMHHLRSHWWMGDWGNRLTRHIYSVLDAHWRAHICWIVDLIDSPF